MHWNKERTNIESISHSICSLEKQHFVTISMNTYRNFKCFLSTPLQEFSCLLPGFIYFLAIPANFLLLTVFYLCNVNNVSWGTREVVTKEEKSKKEAEEDVKKSKSWNIFSARGLRTLVEEIRDLVKTVWGLKRDLEGQARGTERVICCRQALLKYSHGSISKIL